KCSSNRFDMAFNTRGDRFNSVLFISGILLYWLLCMVFYSLSELPVDPNDGIAHYHISRYSWVNPSELLNHWGKPMFNILSSPFAQIGYVGMVIFNLTLFSLSAFLVYRLARYFNFRLAGLSPFILMSSMVFFKMVN